MRITNNITFEMLENGNCKIGKDEREIEIRVVAFCDLETKKEFRLGTNLPATGENAVRNEEIAEIYVQRWQIKLP